MVIVTNDRHDGLDVADGFVLPPEVVVSKQAILAMSGAGKSNAAVVLAEQMYDAGYPWVTIDPKGDWWGVRIDGAGPGLPIPVLGGPHGDVPLDPSSGALVARMVAERRLTCVLDVSDFDTRQQLFRFLADFAETLLKVNTEPLHVFAEECDDYLPQRTAEKGELPRCLGAWQRLIKRGRQRGIGSTLVTQRSSAVNKDALNMTDTLIAMRTTAPLDRKAIEGWVDTHGLGRDLVNTLPGLADGEAWVWSPQKLRLTEQIRFHRRRTYDSGATPDLKAPRPGAAHMTEVDLDALKLEMADTIERAAQDDPVRLRAEIAALHRELREVRAAVTEMQPEIVEREVIREVVPKGLIVAAGSLLGAVESMGLDLEAVRSCASGLVDAIGNLPTSTPDQGVVDPPRSAPRGNGSKAAGARPSRSRAAVPVSAGIAADATSFQAAARAATGEVKLTKAERAHLTALHLAAEPLDRRRCSRFAGYTPDAGASKNALSSLRTKGLIEPGNPLVITDAGRALVADSEPLPTGSALLEYWKTQGKVINGKAGAAHLDALAAVYPDAMTTEELALAAGYTPNTGGTKNAVSRLRVLGLIDDVGRGVVRLSDDLVDSPRF